MKIYLVLHSKLSSSISSYYMKILVHIIHAGPLNEAGQYSFTILSTNCNYPLYVFARDPVVYKQVTNILCLNCCKTISLKKICFYIVFRNRQIKVKYDSFGESGFVNLQCFKIRIDFSFFFFTMNQLIE